MQEFVEHLGRQIAAAFPRHASPRLIAAVSGGPDSVALLHLLHALRGRVPLDLHVAHFNHHLRGSASLRDAAFVEALAARLGLPFHQAGARVKAARQPHESIESAARRLRHAYLADLALALHADAVVLAHHSDDQAETVLMRLFRGAGGSGLAGMKALSPSPANPQVHLFRPLLGFSRADLRSLLRRQGWPFRNDISNRDVRHTRNWIRRRLIPLLHQRFGDGVSRVLAREAVLLSDEALHVRESALQWMRRPRRRLASQPPALQRAVLKSELERLGITPSFDRIETLRTQIGIPASVGPGCTVVCDANGCVRIVRQTVESFGTVEQDVLLAARGGEWPAGAMRIQWRFSMGNTITREPCIECFDAAKVGRHVVLRQWRAGDRFQPLGLPVPARLQDLFVNRKIPRERRRQLMLATTEAGVIFWVEGLPPGELFKVTRQTRRRLIWTWSRSTGRSGLGEAP